MNKKVSKVLSVMCGVAAFAGMFGINSASAMDGETKCRGKVLVSLSSEAKEIFYDIHTDCIKALDCMLRGTEIEEGVEVYFDNGNFLSGFEEILTFMKKYESILSRSNGYHILYEFVDFLLNGFKPRYNRDYRFLKARAADFQRRFYSARG